MPVPSTGLGRRLALVAVRRCLARAGDDQRTQLAHCVAQRIDLLLDPVEISLHRTTTGGVLAVAGARLQLLVAAPQEATRIPLLGDVAPEQLASADVDGVVREEVVEDVGLALAGVEPAQPELLHLLEVGA